VSVPYERILVIGAGGFIGCRLCEHLSLAHGATVRGTYHTPARAARVARLAIELVQLDLADERSIDRAVAGCDAVVHCAYGTSGDARSRRELTGAAAGRVASAALRHGVRRFVQLSSVAVWGFDAGPGEIDEDAPTRYVGHPYVDGKVDAERDVADVAAQGLPAVVLRPAAVYGPWSAIWTVAPVVALQTGSVGIVGDGGAPVNTVYVDSVVAAIVLALLDDRAVGDTFVVADEDGLTWRDLYGAYARMASPPLEVRTLSPDEWRRQAKSSGSLIAALRELRALARSPEAAALVRAAAERPGLRRAGGRALRRLPRRRERVKAILERPSSGVRAAATSPQLPSPELMAAQTSGAIFRARKLRELGWAPPVPLERALELTEAWLRFARYL
jgi:nucleoside-diphosphate-sugar epimerase